MSPEFAAAVDPVFLYVSSVVDKIQENKAPQAEEVSDQVRGLLDNAENRLAKRPDWELAKYALVAWVDDLADRSCVGWAVSGGSRIGWSSRSSRPPKRSRTSTLQSQKANELPQKDALEVFYLCVVLGFRGLYGDPEATSHADHFRVATLAGRLGLHGRGRRFNSDRVGLRLLEQGRPRRGARHLWKESIC